MKRNNDLRIARENNLIDYIERYWEINSCQPNYFELAKHLGLKSTSNIHPYIVELVNRGKLVRIIRGKNPRYVPAKILDELKIY